MTTPFDVSVLRLDPKTDRCIRTVMQRICTLIGIPEPPNYLPHISLIPTTQEDRDGVIDRLVEQLEEQPVLNVVFSHVGLFPSGVLFLGVTPSQALIELHQHVYQASRPGPNVPWISLYKPDTWVPHCTLAMTMPNECLGPTFAEVSHLISFPLIGQCTAIELLDVQPHKPARLFRRIDLAIS